MVEGRAGPESALERNRLTCPAPLTKTAHPSYPAPMRHALALLFILAACSSAPAPTRCTPGASVACVCPGVGIGAQVCATGGESYGACVCGVLDAGDDAVAVVDAVAADVVAVVDATSADVVTEDRPAAVDAGGVDVVDATAPPDCGAFYTFCPMGDAGLDRSCVNLANGNRRGQIELVNTNCGACGRSCPGGTICCGGRCFAPDASLTGTGIPNCARIP